LRSAALGKLYGFLHQRYEAQNLLLQAGESVLQALIDILADVEEHTSTRENATSCLFGLVMNPSIAKKVRKKLAEGQLSNLLPGIAELIRGGEADSINAMGLLHNIMGHEHHDTSVMVTQSGFVEAVVEVLGSRDDDFVSCASQVLLKLSSFDANTDRVGRLMGALLEVCRRGLAGRATYLGDAVGVLANISSALLPTPVPVEEYVSVMSDIIQTREDSIRGARLSALGGLANLTEAVPRSAAATIIGLILLATETIKISWGD
jgi:hypothetical protein